MRALILTLALSPALALAEPRLSGDDENAIVTADHAEWTGAAPEAHGDVIEIPLKEGATSQHITLDDKTVKRIDVAIEGTPRLIVRLHHSKLTTLRTAALMQVTNVNGEVIASFPREPGHGAVEPDGDTKPEAKIAPKLETKKIAKAEPKPETKIETPNEAKAEPKVEAPIAAQPISAAAFAEEPSHGAGRVWSALVLLCIAAGAVIMAMLRKKSAAPKGEEPFRIIASRTLGAKSKLFMVEVEDKKLLFAVDDKGTRLVSTFMKSRADGSTASATEAQASSADIGAMFDEEPNTFAEEPKLRSESPAVAGLLRLRERHGLDTSDTGEVDERSDTDWAEMLLRATNRRGQS